MRARAAVAAVVLLLAAAYALYLTKSGLTLFDHEGDPAFTVLYDDELLEVRDGGLLTLAGERKELTVTLTVEPLRLPEYDGEATGLLPLLADDHLRRVAPAGAQVVADERARLGEDPGYEIAYESGAERRAFVFAAPEGERDGVLMTLTQRQPPARDRGGGRKLALAARDVWRSLEFGLDRD